jgi:hypothetical protein
MMGKIQEGIRNEFVEVEKRSAGTYSCDIVHTCTFGGSEDQKIVQGQRARSFHGGRVRRIEM